MFPSYSCRHVLQGLYSAQSIQGYIVLSCMCAEAPVLSCMRTDVPLLA